MKMEEAEDLIGDIEDKTRLRELNNSTKCNIICSLGVPEEEWEKRAEDLFEL